MEKRMKLQIDGKEIEAPAGMNLIDAAELAGVHIPNLCYMKGMKGVGACRLCLIEVEGLKAPVIACNTKVRDGMVIHTQTERLKEVRKFVIDLILSMHPLDCMTCTKAGVCNLQQYAYDFELKESSFTRKKSGYPVDEANPFIRRDPEYCILCGRCVRVCREQGTNVLEFMGRGIESTVTTAVDKPLQESGCTFCGSCVDACPVNALLESDRWRRGREWEYAQVNSVCLLCGSGCDISLSLKEGTIQKINSGAVSGSAGKYLCAYGRFGFDCIEADSRVTVPLKRVNGQLTETTWEDALALVADSLRKAGHNAGFVSVAGITNEDALTLRKLAKNAVKTKNADTTMSLYADAGVFIQSDNANIDDADVILLIGMNPSQWDRTLPALDAAIRRRVSRGAKLIVVNSSDTSIAGAATVTLQGDEVSILKGLARALTEKGLKSEKSLVSSVMDAMVTEEIEKAAALYAEAGNPLLISSPALFESAANIALFGGKVVAAGLESNARGVALMGLTTEGKTAREMMAGGVKVLYAVGEIPLDKRPDGVEFLVVQHSHLSELAKHADVVLPSATPYETSGTIVDYLGRLKHLPKALEPRGQSKRHGDIFIGLAKVMGSAIRKPTQAEIKKAVKGKVKHSFQPFAKKEGIDVFPAEFIASLNASVINGSRLLWLKETGRGVAANIL
ncbi:MAG: molybdopterin-dependent oxidoreductase [Nitrospirota bacterium]